MKKIWFLCLAAGNLAMAQGDFPPAAGEEGSTAIHSSDSRINAWAVACEIVRGPQDVSNTSLGDASFGTEESAIGPASPAVVSLGDGGMATLTFDPPIENVDGYDFAVFENAFSDTFLELAFVEVSSDGENFFRFEAISQTPVEEQVGGFGELDPTYIHNLAGKYRVQYGTPFELEELESFDGLDIMAVSHVRIIDVVGKIDGAHVSTDVEGNVINDPWPTPFESSGFDLNAVAVLGAENVSLEEENWIRGLYPNPVEDLLTIHNAKADVLEITIMDLGGRVLKTAQLNSGSNRLDLSGWQAGVYLIRYEGKTLKFIKS